MSSEVTINWYYLNGDLIYLSVSGFGRSQNSEYVLFLNILEECIDEPQNEKNKVSVWIYHTILQQICRVLEGRMNCMSYVQLGGLCFQV